MNDLGPTRRDWIVRIAWKTDKLPELLGYEKVDEIEEKRTDDER